MGSMEIGASAAGSADLSAPSPPDLEFESSPVSWTWDTSHLDFGLGGPVIPPPPGTALSSCSAIPPPPSTALSGSLIPPPPSTALSSCSAIPPPPSTALSASVIPPPPTTVLPGSVIPPPPWTGR